MTAKCPFFTAHYLLSWPWLLVSGVDPPCLRFQVSWGVLKWWCKSSQTTNCSEKEHFLPRRYSLSAAERADRILSLSSLVTHQVWIVNCCWPPVTTKVWLRRPISSCRIPDSTLSRVWHWSLCRRCQETRIWPWWLKWLPRDDIGTASVFSTSRSATRLGAISLVACLKHWETQ